MIGIENGRDAPIGIDESDCYRVFEVAVTDSKEELVPTTRFGKGRTGGVGSGGKTPRRAKGESYRRSYNLARLFDLSEKGEYTLVIRKKVRVGPKDVIELELKDVPLRLREPTEADLTRWGRR